MAANGGTPNVFTINVNGVIVQGKGQSEEAAKEDALKQIRDMVKDTPGPPLGGSHRSALSSLFRAKNDLSENMIGKLQEYCQANHWPLPLYTLENAKGPSHLPNFSVKCKILGFTAVGCGTSKKEAKHTAAMMVFDSIIKNTEEHECKEPELGSNLRVICSSPFTEGETSESVGIPLLPHVEWTINQEQKPAADLIESFDDLHIPYDFIVLHEKESKKPITAEEQPEETEDTLEPAKPVPALEPAKPVPALEPAKPVPAIEPAKPVPALEPAKPIPLPSLEDILCVRLQNLGTNLDD